MPSSPPPPSQIHTSATINYTSDPLTDSSTDPITGSPTTSPTRRRSTAENILSAIAPPTFADPLRPQRNFANLVGLVASGISNGVRSGVQAHRDFNASREVAEPEHQAAEKDAGADDSRDVMTHETVEADDVVSRVRDRDHSGEMRRPRGLSEGEGKGKNKTTVYDLVMRAETMLRGDPQTKQSSRQAGGFGVSAPRHDSTSTARESGSTSQVTSVSAAKEAEACAEASQMPQEEAPPEYDASLPSYRDAHRASRRPVDPVESEPARLFDTPPAPVGGNSPPERYRPSPPPTLPGYLPVEMDCSVPSPPATPAAPTEREYTPTFPVVPTHRITVPMSEGTSQLEDDRLDDSAPYEVTNDAHRALEPAT